MVLDSLYKAMLNMRLRRKFVYSNDKVNSDYKQGVGEECDE